MTHAWNHTYLGDKDQSGGSWLKVSPNKVGDTPISKIIRAKWTRGVAKAMSACFSSEKPWVQTLVPSKKKKKKVSKCPKQKLPELKIEYI
jgi:hypothetical protein